MNAIRKLALVALVVAPGAPLAVAADSPADRTITGEITPGVYGRVDTSKRPVPQRLYEHAMLVDAPDANVKVEPVYLHVPPEHARNWKRYCREYQACNRPVYFVKSAEYEPGYTPSKEERPKRKYRSGW